MLTLSSDLTALFFTVPTLVEDLGASATESLWIVHAYGFLIAGFLITMGRVSDRVGARRLLLWGASVFAVLSVFAAFAWTPGVLVLARALLGVAGATLMPSLFSLLREMFRDDDQRRFAIAIMFSSFTIGGAIGPLLGGALVEAFWWGAIFLINVPPMALLVVLGALVLPERHESRVSRIDPSSVALSVTGMLAVVYGLQEIAAGAEGESASLPPGFSVFLVVAGLAMLVLFVRRQRRLADPLFDLVLLKNRRVAASLLTLLLTGIGSVGLFFLFTQHLQWVGGFTPLVAGILTLPYIAADILGALAAPALARRWRTSSITVGGLLIVALGAVLTALAVADGRIPLLILAVAVIGVGHGAAMALLSDAIISSAPEDRVGSAAAAQEVGGELGAALGIAIGGMTGILVFRASLDRMLSPDTPAELAGALRSSIHEAFAAAHGNAGDSAPLVETIRDATGNGLLAYALLAAGLVAAAAGITAAAFSRRRAPSPAADSR
ncbi:MFS transporter [Prauserella halophila]|uniref:MFS transporter n=1 Tax=Prauserella halophila TaxID=185641 RepID=A0ABP4GW83_9PSEU|nr:MFS transporter [Prauserella halophila]